MPRLIVYILLALGYLVLVGVIAHIIGSIFKGGEGGAR
jgi:hypothetical protein